MKIPAEKECFALLRKYKTPWRIMQHSIMVDRVAMYIARKMVAKGYEINLELLHAACLLHDIAKVQCLGEKEKNHGTEGKLILEKEGYPEVGKVVEAHQTKELIEGTLDTWERKLLNYADKVAGDRIKTLDERFAYFKKRYVRYIDDISRAEPLAKKMERKLFAIIGGSPEDLKKL